MHSQIATARANPNIAFIKYWGNRDEALRLPANGSISMNLRGLETTTTVAFNALGNDELIVNGEQQSGAALDRVTRHLDQLRKLANTSQRARIQSVNNFPTGAGIASSASAFAALTVAAAAALGLELEESELSALARLGSGSASRSIPTGFVEWYAGDDHQTSYAESIAPPEHWRLVDLVAVVSHEHKATGSTGGHSLALTSPLQGARLAGAPQRLRECRNSIISRDFETLSAVVEHDALMMHAVMMTSRPALMYWLPATLTVIQSVVEWRRSGVPACFTIDAGPNVHVITPAEHTDNVRTRLLELEEIATVLTAEPGGPAELLTDHRN